MATTTGRVDNITEESTLAIPSVCWCGFFFNLFVVSQLRAMVAGKLRGDWWQRRRDERTTSLKKVRWLSLCCLSHAGYGGGTGGGDSDVDGHQDFGDH